MNVVDFIHRRKGRYQAQILSEFEESVEEHLPPEIATNFKGTVRQKLNAMAVDISEVIVIEPFEVNAAAIELRDDLRRPTGHRSNHT
jgi:hypothetical protein